MPDVLLAARPVLPWTDGHGNTISVHDGHVYLNGRQLPPVSALDVSAALAVAVQEIAVQRITNPNQTHPTEGA